MSVFNVPSFNGIYIFRFISRFLCFAINIWLHNLHLLYTLQLITPPLCASVTRRPGASVSAFSFSIQALKLVGVETITELQAAEDKPILE